MKKLRRAVITIHITTRMNKKKKKKTKYEGVLFSLNRGKRGTEERRKEEVIRRVRREEQKGGGP